MATGIVITVAEKLYAVLHSQELKEICSMFGYESQLDELKTTVFTIKSVLLDAESKYQELTHEGRDYIERLKDAVYDVDDLLDEFNTIVQKEKNKKGGKVSKKVRRFFSRSNQFLVAFNMSNEIKSLRSKLEKIAKDRQQFGLSDVYVPLKRKEETMSFASEDNIIGRETDKEAIVGMLLGDSMSQNGVDYVSIVGIGGLGKTSLAQLVYNDPRIEKAFKLRLWVCVSDDFVLDKIFRQMLGKDGSKIDMLQREVRNLIQGKSYLLVLDDVWSESRDEWDNLKSFLNLGGTGSRILVTSRSKKVARVVGDEFMHELKGLSDENSWNLFKRLAFEQGKEPVNSNDHLFDIGKEIVKKCVNVPLSIRVVGSMLYDQDESKWLSLRSANLMEVGQDEGGIMSILKYSYYHLTPALKTCFSYCALFPKNFEMEKKLLIRLWLAQGCLDNPHDQRSAEDVGEEYFSILLQRCFLQDVEKDFWGEIKWCKMHDLIHDLALLVAGKETIVLDSNTGQFDQRIRHLSLTENGCSILESPSTQLREMKKLRTFLTVGMYPELLESNLTTICSQLSRLRTLNLNFVKFDTLPAAVGNLLHLRYLELSNNVRLKALPNSITKLINLLVLNLDWTGIIELPQDMRKLVNLRDLSLSYCNKLRHMPSGLDTLTSLHMLPMFVVGDETFNQGKIGKLRDLKALVSLRGELDIIFNNNFSCDVSEYENIELLRIAQLTHLILQFSEQGAIHEMLLASLQPHSRLKTLRIVNYKGFKLPTWSESLTTSLPHLVRIYLRNFDSLEILPSLSQLRHLKILTVDGISNVEFMESDVVVVPSDDQLPFFPSLVELQLSELPKLKGWWREETSRVTGEANASSVVVPSFPCLSDLILENCPNLMTFPSCPKLVSADLRGCHEELTLLGSKTAIPNNPTTGLVVCPKKLTIDNVGAIGCLFEESLEGIHHLSIEYFMGESFSNVTEFVRHDSSVETLTLGYCPNLKSLSGVVEHLTTLQSLTISECQNLELENNDGGVTVTPWKSLQLLSSLTLTELPKLLNLPKEFRHLTSLEFLEISFCVNLEALPEWLNCLTSLQKLTIMRCDKLKSLPDAIGHMPSLKTFDLKSTNVDLRKRCGEPDGEDWPKICRIPRLSLNEMVDSMGVFRPIWIYNE
ncbi:hypothetical protein vseg_012965 [Gypsophila vaccaria]